VTEEIIRVKSFCKINLALAVLGRRADGFHEIRTVLQTIDLHDELEFSRSPHLRLHCDGLASVPVEENLVWRAACSLRELHPAPGGAGISLRKKIPPGSGLGGGSSNAAATLLALRRLWDLDIAAGDLRAIAGRLGSDVPFFLDGGTALAAGRGEQVRPLPDLPLCHLVILFPGVAIPTRLAYHSLNLELTSPGGGNRIDRLCGRLDEGLEGLTGIFNDFETSILPAYPAVREAKDALTAAGAAAAMLSGSGSTVFGFFRNEESAIAASRSLTRGGWRVFPAKTLSRAEYFQRMFG
jgi:4-diphosphocytidyl-2-C-methyl-D-erythritol kinase